MDPKSCIGNFLPHCNSCDDAKEQELQTPAIDDGGMTDPGVNAEV